MNLRRLLGIALWHLQGGKPLPGETEARESLYPHHRPRPNPKKAQEKPDARHES